MFSLVDLRLLVSRRIGCTDFNVPLFEKICDYVDVIFENANNCFTMIWNT